MAELLIEIFSEEIPARMQKRAGEALERGLSDGLTKAGLNVSDMRVMTGPRRLTVMADIPAMSPDVTEERKGPRVGAPEQALAGFMRGAGISDISEAEIRSDKKGEFYVAVKRVEGRPSGAIVTEVLAEVMNDFPWSKSMRSGASSFRWVRPLRGLTLLLDGEVLAMEIGGITSGNTVHGHRQHGPGPFTITSAKDYVETLTGAGHVVLSREDRRSKILEDARAVCAKAGLELVEDEGLLDEVTGLVEWPVVLLGDMDADFLQLPDEVIRLTLKSHQKTFTVRDPKTGALAPHFVIIANNDAADGGALIKAGNAKVISARLSDALFFQTQDRKRSLESYFDDLDNVVFHKKLGSVKDKALRVAALAREIAPLVGADPDVAEQAARLAKCDLVTQTVIEATSLQGQIGRLMYEAEGGDAAIAQAIEDHYKPQGPSDRVPTAPVSIAVALADKLDTLVGFWAIDEKPTGSKDPFALRRAALGVVRILLERSVSFQTTHLVRRHWFLGQKLYGDKEIDLPANPKQTDIEDIQRHLDAELKARSIDLGLRQWGSLIGLISGKGSLLAFLHDRLRVYLRDQGRRHDVIDAVISQGGDDLLTISDRVTALGKLLGTPDGENLVQGYKRAANILRAERKKGDLPEAPDGDYSAPEAASLRQALDATKPKIDAGLASGDYAAALDALADLRAPIDAFFEGVMVNSEVEAERARRLALLFEIEQTFFGLADFSKLDG